jgi:hypothetical protein
MGTGWRQTKQKELGALVPDATPKRTMAIA